MIKNVYKDKLLKYPLTDTECTEIDEVWAFLDKFKKDTVFMSDYRKNVIKDISSNYTVCEFLVYEKILDKLFWNLRWLIYPLFVENISEKEYWKTVTDKIDKIPYKFTLCKEYMYTDLDDLDSKIKNSDIYSSTYYRSSINKLIIVNNEDKILYTKLFEGSSDIFPKNYFNLLTSTVLFDRELYESVVKNPYYYLTTTNVQLPEYYITLDYGFPNMNMCAYSVPKSDSSRKNRIEKMYYNTSTKYWFTVMM